MKVKFLLSAGLTAGVLFGQASGTVPPAPSGAAPPPPKTAPNRPAVQSVPPSTGPTPPAAPAPMTPSAANPDTVVITAGDQKITAAEFDAFISALPEQYRAQAVQGPGKRQIGEQIALMRLLSTEAKKRGLDKDDTIRIRLAMRQEDILASAALDDMVKTTSDEASLRTYYDQHKGDYETVQARHILVRFTGSRVPVRPGQPEQTEEQALARATELRTKLEGGANFEELAKAESDDTTSGSQGGDLGAFKRGSMVPAFEETAFKLQPGEISQPVKSPFGYHIIKVEKHESKSFEEAKADVTGKMKPEAARRVIEELKSAQKVELNDSFFGPAPVAPMAPAGQPVPLPAPPAGK